MLIYISLISPFRSFYFSDINIKQIPPDYSDRERSIEANGNGWRNPRYIKVERQNAARGGLRNRLRLIAAQ